MVPLGVTLATTGVALLLEALIFRRPISLDDGDAGELPLDDLTCTFHFLVGVKDTLKSAAPLLPGLTFYRSPFSAQTFGNLILFSSSITKLIHSNGTSFLLLVL